MHKEEVRSLQLVAYHLHTGGTREDLRLNPEGLQKIIYLGMKTHYLN